MVTGTTVKMLVSFKLAAPLRANIILCIRGITAMMLVSFEPIVRIPCMLEIMTKILVFLGSTTLLSITSQFNVYDKYRQYKADEVAQPNSTIYG